MFLILSFRRVRTQEVAVQTDDPPKEWGGCVFCGLFINREWGSDHLPGENCVEESNSPYLQHGIECEIRFCKSCGMISETLRDHIKHQLFKHGGLNTIICNSCGRPYITQRAFIDHCRKVHGSVQYF